MGAREVTELEERLGLLDAERVARGEFSNPVPVAPGARDEIAAVAAAFNAMTAELGAYRKDLEAQVGGAVKKARSAEKNLITAQRLARRVCSECKALEEIPVQALIDAGVSPE